MNDCTERALEGHRTRRNHTPVGRLVLWAASAAAVVLFTVMAIRSFSHTPVTTQLPQHEQVVAQRYSAPATPTTHQQADSNAPHPETNVVGEEPQIAHAEHIEQASNNEHDELDQLLSQLSDVELMAIDDEYYIDKIPEY